MVLLDEYLTLNRKVVAALKDGADIPTDKVHELTNFGSRIFGLSKRDGRYMTHSSVFDFTEMGLKKLSKSLLPLASMPKGPKIRQHHLADKAPPAPKWKSMSMAAAEQKSHVCASNPGMLKLHNSTPEWDGNLDGLPLKELKTTANGINFKVRDVSKICNCQVHKVFEASRNEYIDACIEAKKPIPDSFYVTGEPAPPS